MGIVFDLHDVCLSVDPQHGTVALHAQSAPAVQRGRQRQTSYVKTHCLPLHDLETRTRDLAKKQCDDEPSPSELLTILFFSNIFSQMLTFNDFSFLMDVLRSTKIATGI